MKPIFYLFIACAFLGACSEFRYELKSDDGKFTVRFPKEPTKDVKNFETEMGDPINLTMYSCMSQDSNTIFLLSYSNIPDYTTANPDSIMENAIMGPAQAMRTSIVDKKKLNLNGNPGLYFKGLGLDIAMVYHLYVVKDRMYQLAILNRIPREPTKEEMDGFMGSFKLK